MWSKKLVFFFALILTLCIVKTAKAQDLYGPPLPPGFTEPTRTYASEPASQAVARKTVQQDEKRSLWMRFKDTVFTMFSNSEHVSSVVSITKVVEPQADQRIVDLVNNSRKQSAALVRLLKDPETLKPQARVDIPSISQQEPFVAVLKHNKYNPEQSPEAEVRFDNDYFTNNVKLLAYSDKPLVPVSAMHVDELKLVRALLAVVGDKYNSAADLLHRLGTNTKHELVELKALAFLGHVLYEQKLSSLASVSLARALNSRLNDDIGTKFNSYALETLSRVAAELLTAKDIGKSSTYEQLLQLGALSAEARSFALLLLAERAFDNEKFESARKLAQQVAPKSRWSEKARYLAALCAYASKPDSRTAQELAGRELTDLFRTVQDNTVFDAVATALGRIHFILGNYKAAHQYLSQVTKETNIWLEAAVDNGWALLKSGDKHHAVGNMFTLHTPYFDGAYMPDSYFLQTLGYQELCQFGDAFTAVKKYKMQYVPLTKSVTEFNSAAKKSTSAHYDAVIAYLSKQAPKIHPVALRELARHPEFIKRQNAINLMTREERNAAIVLPAAGARIFTWAKKSFEDSKAKYKNEMAKFLRTRATNMQEELKFVNSNMALLEYEIYAGASQNLALQAAQNFAVNEKNAERNRPDDDGKEYWPYEEEIWEDELNNFRSKIVDGCAKNRKPAAS